MWTRGEQIPHFEVVTVDHQHVRYRDVWQQRHLLLILLGAVRGAEGQAYVDHLRTHERDLTAHETTLVITADPLPGAPSPSVVIADRWGEIQHVATGDRSGSTTGLPLTSELLEWLRYVQSQCPECQGETK